MALSRTTPVRALRNLSQQGRPQARSLHMLPNTNRPTIFANAASKQSTTTATPTQAAFTTSQTFQSQFDASTMDFFLPMDSLRSDEAAALDTIRVPLLPTTQPRRSGVHAVEPESGIFTAASTTNGSITAAAAAATPAAAGLEDTHAAFGQVHTLAGNGTHWSAPSSLSDHDALAEVDFATLAKDLRKAVHTVEDKVAEETGMIKQIWRSMLADVGLGPERTT